MVVQDVRESTGTKNAFFYSRSQQSWLSHSQAFRPTEWPLAYLAKLINAIDDLVCRSQEDLEGTTREEEASFCLFVG